MSSAEFGCLVGSEESSDGLEGRIDDDIEQTIRGRHYVQSPRIVLPSGRKSCTTCICCLVSVILISSIIVFYITWDDESSPTQSHLEAMVGGAWPRTYNSYPKSCTDDYIECCHIYGKTQEYTISHKRIVKRDKSGSNCPSLSTLVANYNDYHIRYFGQVNCSAINCCSIDIFRDEVIRNNRTVEKFLIPLEVSKENIDTCPTIRTLITRYENYYQETDSTLAIIALCIVVCVLLRPKGQ